MRRTSFIMVIIFTVMSLNIFVYRVYAQCVEDCMNKCEATIDERYKWGEGVVKSTIDSTDLLIQKNGEKKKCLGKCEDECLQTTKKSTVDTGSALKKDPEEKK